MSVHQLRTKEGGRNAACLFDQRKPPQRLGIVSFCIHQNGSPIALLSAGSVLRVRVTTLKLILNDKRPKIAFITDGVS